MSTLSLFNHKLPKTITNNQIVTIKLHFYVQTLNYHDCL
ncbi:hypothetical protein CSC51_1107 [Staphylococcus aureus]|nr:hypothetical protein CA347_712 [Staphylococcus aureus CA-347]AWE56440.1 hypothetical protein CSC51_1107 [Staphylococcus aureus]AWE61417.1 hypothetical protein CSC49_1355 [Staphylococcus aureus]AWQ99505.1 hypothetical protein CSC56_0946 [Staphylococcus aureus]EHT78016.1 hypothetical protein SACIG1524_1210 [Staphylococcus aureus subsp. aureus CIG1524]